MIDPTDKDEGRRVLYRPVVSGKPVMRLTAPTEHGVIKCVTDAYVFVCFATLDDNWTTAMACYRECLEWNDDYFTWHPKDLAAQSRMDLVRAKEGCDEML